MSDFILKPKPDDVDQVWELEVNGKPVDANQVVLRSPYGIFSSGFGIEGYPRILFQESSFGGSVDVLWLKRDGTLYVAVIDMDRSDTMGDSLCFPGMYVFDGETHLGVSKRILTRELGLNADNYVIEPIGIVNPNRSTYFTPEGEGVHYYGIHIPDDQVVDGENGVLVFKDDIAKAPDAGLQKIVGCKFRPWHTLGGYQDAFIHTGLGLLLIHQENNK